MSHLLCLFVTLIVVIIAIVLLYWVWSKAKAMMTNPPFTPKLLQGIELIFALIIACAIIYWMWSGFPCLVPFH